MKLSLFSSYNFFFFFFFVKLLSQCYSRVVVLLQRMFLMIIVFHLFNFLYTDDYSSTLACFIYVFFFSILFI